MIAVLAAINVFGAKESTGVNILLAVVDFATQLLLVLVGVFLVFSPETLVDNVHLGVAPTWKDFVLAIPIGMLAYTGIETISNMSEEARDEAKTIPTAINRVRIAVFAIYFTLPAVALSALPVTSTSATGEYQTLLGLTEEEGGYAGDPILGVVKTMDLGPLQYDRRDLRRPAGRDDPVPGHQRGHHRRLAARVLDGHPPPDARRAAAAAPAVPHAVDRHPRLLDVRDRRDPARPGGVPRRDLLVRRAAVVHDGARGGVPAADQAARLPALLPRSRQHDGARLRHPAVRGRRRHVHGDRVRGDRRAQPGRWPPPASAGCVVGIAIYVAFRRRQGLDLVSTVKVAIPQPVVDHEAEYDSVLVPLVDGHYDEQVMATASRLAAAPAPRHPRARARHGPERAADRRDDDATRRRPPTR